MSELSPKGGSEGYEACDDAFHVKRVGASTGGRFRGGPMI